MKALLLLIATGLILVLPARAQSTATLYTEAQRAFLAGDTNTAKDKFNAVLSADPNNIGAKNYLRTILTAEKKNQKSTMAAQLAVLIVPKVSFKDASLDSVLEFLKSKAAELSEQKVTPSFVLQLPPDFARQMPITLELTNVPFTEILRYLGEITSTKFEIQQYAIVVKPKN